MVLVCPFIMNIYYRLLLHVLFYLKIDNITGKSRLHGKATLVSVVAGYRNTRYILKRSGKSRFQGKPNLVSVVAVYKNTMYTLI
jgi:hypothetical protein